MFQGSIHYISIGKNPKTFQKKGPKIWSHFKSGLLVQTFAEENILNTPLTIFISMKVQMKFEWS